jgi:succinate dehydrogenase flavin-adding protein (antitoxin of CptAB toxin-antitoxin module)
MQINFGLVTYDDDLDRFELDADSHQIELTDEEIKEYELLKSSDLNLYHWLKESDSFLKYMKEEVYQDSENKKFAIRDINDTSYVRFYFFKVTSGDSHYEYFKELFNIHEESDWQDREDIGEEILQYLSTKRKELILELG